MALMQPVQLRAWVMTKIISSDLMPHNTKRKKEERQKRKEQDTP